MGKPYAERWFNDLNDVLQHICFERITVKRLVSVVKRNSSILLDIVSIKSFGRIALQAAT
jgi:hypothetical protein